MQYLLTPNEYDDLKNKKSSHVDRLRTKLQEVCTYASDNVPIKFWGRGEATPWGCVLSTSDEWYCDKCPTQKQCPYNDKQWSQ